MSGDVEAREAAFVFGAAIGAVRARRWTAGTCATPTRGGRARTPPSARGRHENERADRSWLRDALATGRGGRKHSRTAEGARDALETMSGKALSLTARRIEECRPGEEDAPILNVFWQTCAVSVVVSRISRRFGGNQQRHFFPAPARGRGGTSRRASEARARGIHAPGETGARLYGTESLRTSPGRTSRARVDVGVRRDRQRQRLVRDARRAFPRPFRDVRSEPPETGASEVRRRSSTHACARAFVADTSSVTWARTSSRGRGGTRARPGSTPRAPSTSATTRRRPGVRATSAKTPSRLRRAPRGHTARALCTRGSRFAT